MAINVFKREDGVLHVSCSDRDATVEHLCEAMQWVSDSKDVVKEFRTWPTRTDGTCYGCTYCCERFNIFLNNIDVHNLSKHEGVSPEEFMAYATIYEPWKVNRVRLKEPVNYCLGEQGCAAYAVRPLICRLYICAPHSSLLRQVIAEVNLKGNEALVDWRLGQNNMSNPFTGKMSYSEVLLREALSPVTWAELITTLNE